MSQEQFVLRVCGLSGLYPVSGRSDGKGFGLRITFYNHLPFEEVNMHFMKNSCTILVCKRPRYSLQLIPEEAADVEVK